MRVFLVACLAVVLVACHPLPANMQVAKSAGDFMLTINQAANIIISLPVADSVKTPWILKINNLQLNVGPRLANALDAYDRAADADKAAAVSGIQKALDEATAVVNSLQLPGGSTYAQAANLLTSLAATFLKIRTLLALPPAPATAAAAGWEVVYGV